MAAFKDGSYRNILAEVGYDSKEIEDKLADLYLERTFAAGDEILIDVIAGDFSFSRMKEADTENMVPVQEEQNYG